MAITHVSATAAMTIAATLRYKSQLIEEPPVSVAEGSGAEAAVVLGRRLLLGMGGFSTDSCGLVMV